MAAITSRMPDQFVAPELLPSLEAEARSRDGEPMRVPGTYDLPRRRMRALIAPPSVPALLSAHTSALVVGGDETFVCATSELLREMGVRVRSSSTVSDALTALEEDIAENGCITYDQIIAEAEADNDGAGDEEGAETLVAELRSTSWPASVVFVTPHWPNRADLARFTRCGARAVVLKPVNRTELGRLFTHLKRTPHEDIWASRRVGGLIGCAGASNRRRAAKPPAATVHSALPSAAEPRRSTPLHNTCMGVGLATFLHVHAGRQKGPKPKQRFEEAAVFDCQTMAGVVDDVNPEWIYRFVVIVMVNLQLDEELLVTAVILLERACRVAELVLTAANWQSVLLAAIIVAAKTHYDQSVWLGDFVDRLRMYPLDASYLHEIEMAFLRALRFCVIVRPSSFYRYAAEIATLHDSYCPYTRSMTCDLTYRMLANERSPWSPRGALAGVASANGNATAPTICAPCAPAPAARAKPATKDVLAKVLFC